MREFIKDEKGRVIGSSSTTGNLKTYIDASGKVVARVTEEGKTLDDKGSFKGFGDQGMRLFGERNGSN